MNLKEYEVAAEDALEHFEQLQWWGHPDLLEWHLTNLKENGGGILLAFNEEGRMVGQLDYVKSTIERRYHIIWLLVDKDFRRKGIAKSLIMELQRIAKENGILRIWTEAEDERTEALYRRIGNVADVLENYWIDLNFDLEGDISGYELVFEEGELVDAIPEPWKPRLPVKEISLDQITPDFFQEYQRIIGDYLTPEFDFTQLVSSINSMASQFVWGETAPLMMVKYILENGSIVVILTQYVRAFQKGKASKEELHEVILDVIHRLAVKNFLAVDIQVLKGRGLGRVFEEAGFAKVEEDPVFEITDHS